MIYYLKLFGDFFKIFFIEQNNNVPILFRAEKKPPCFGDFGVFIELCN